MVEVLIFTFKEGLLSRAAHDLKIAAGDVEVSQEGDAVRARIGAGSLRVVCAMKRGREASGTLKPKDRAEIERTTREEVLQVARHPHITFSGRDAGGALTGELTLRGVTRPLSARWRAEGGRRVAEVSLDQRDFGIRPYQAMMGALKVQRAVRVRITAPARSAPVC